MEGWVGGWMNEYIYIYCDVHAVVLFWGSKDHYMVMTNGCFLGICSEKMSSLRSGPRLYISDSEAAENSSLAQELVDGQWEPVGSAGGPGPWRNSAGVVTQLWESVVIIRDSVVIGCKCVTECNPVNPAVNPNPVIYSRHTREILCQKWDWVV
jgi:hypothetical protein